MKIIYYKDNTNLTKKYRRCIGGGCFWRGVTKCFSHLEQKKKKLRRPEKGSFIY
jgi:hypothetical protein